MNISELSDLELNEALMRALGWEWNEALWIDLLSRVSGGWVRGEQTADDPRPFASSTDALKEPEKRLLDAGWFLNLEICGDSVSVSWDNGAPAFEWAAGALCEVEARARAEAVLAGLIALKESGSPEPAAATYPTPCSQKDQ